MTEHAGKSRRFLALPAKRLRRGRWEELEEMTAREERVRLVHDTATRNLWAWPFDLEDLVLGHVLLECLPRHARNNLELPPDKNYDSRCHPCGVLTGTEPVPLRNGTVTRLPAEPGLHLFRISLDAATIPGGGEAGPMTASDVIERMREFIAIEGHWDGTGSFHRAGLLCPRGGAFVALAEDIGRHNCVDRLAGFCARNRLDPTAHVLFITARLTGSLYAKARRAGFSGMISRSAVTGASCLAAGKENVTLVGFCRPNEERMTIFCDGPGRIRK